jgi:hypothetical protein
MATLENRTIVSTYKGLLQIDNSNAGVDGTVRTVEDGEGTSSALQLSSTTVNVNGTFKVGGYTVTVPAAVTFGGAFTSSSTVSLTGALTTAGAFTTVGAYGVTLTATNTTSITLPTTGTLATIAGSETLTNKTLTTPIISTISNTGTLTLPTSTDTLVGRATTDTLTNKTLTSPTTNNGTFNSPTLVTPALGTVASGNISACTSTSMVMVTPVLGTPTSGALTNCTSIPVANATGVLPLANGGSGYANAQQFVQAVKAGVTNASGTTRTPVDNTIPQISEGTEIATLAITPKNASNILEIIFHGVVGSSTGDNVVIALHQDSTANALQAIDTTITTANDIAPVTLRYLMAAGTTSSTTFRLRAGNVAGTWYVGQSGTCNLGGVMVGTFTITERTP